MDPTQNPFRFAIIQIYAKDDIQAGCFPEAFMLRQLKNKYKGSKLQHNWRSLARNEDPKPLLPTFSRTSTIFSCLIYVLEIKKCILTRKAKYWDLTVGAPFIVPVLPDLYFPLVSAIWFGWLQICLFRTVKLWSIEQKLCNSKSFFCCDKSKTTHLETTMHFHFYKI